MYREYNYPDGRWYNYYVNKDTGSPVVTDNDYFTFIIYRRMEAGELEEYFW
ncbi:MAG: hypothetical protein NUK65_02630 [Firmicutes bacterium]|nr:hypothetical protein [Bacillota bacterium]